jgi:hypothetical protein
MPRLDLKHLHEYGRQKLFWGKSRITFPAVEAKLDFFKAEISNRESILHILLKVAAVIAF